MAKKSQDTKHRIINVTKELIDEYNDINEITIRKIAEKADVGIGLINYHFKSRDDLLSLIVGELMSQKAKDYVTSQTFGDLEPVEKLKCILKDLFEFGDQHDKVMKHILVRDLLKGDFGAAPYIVPILKEVFSDSKDEFELRIIALQILLPIQICSLNPSEFDKYSKINLKDKDHKDNFIDLLIDNLVK